VLVDEAVDRLVGIDGGEVVREGVDNRFDEVGDVDGNAVIEVVVFGE